MIRKATYALVVTLALLGALVLPTAQPASAAGSCSIVTPTRVWVDSPYELIRASLGSNCAANNAAYASWDVRHSYYGPYNIFIFDNTSSDSIGFYDWEHYGTYYVEPSLAWDVDYNDLTQNTRSFVVRSGSRAYASATRSGSYVTLVASATYYNRSASAYRPWRNDKVVLRYRTPGTSTWRYLRTVYTASNGKASYRFYAPKTRYYQASSTATSLVWGRTSAAVAR